MSKSGFDFWENHLYYNRHMQRLAHWLRFNWLYFGQPRWDTGTSPPELIEFIRQHPPGRALDLGCGTGTNLLTLAKAGWQVTGVDFVPKAASQARRKLASARLAGDIRLDDVTRLETLMGKAPYTLALDIGCYHGLSAAQRSAYRDNLDKILAPGGWFLLYAMWADTAQDMTHSNAPNFGITQLDIDALSSQLALTKRQDGSDPRGRLTTWLWFQKPAAA